MKRFLALALLSSLFPLPLPAATPSVQVYITDFTLNCASTNQRVQLDPQVVASPVSAFLRRAQVTDINGQFTFTNLPAGTYKLQIPCIADQLIAVPDTSGTLQGINLVAGGYPAPVPSQSFIAQLARGAIQGTNAVLYTTATGVVFNATGGGGASQTPLWFQYTNLDAGVTIYTTAATNAFGTNFARFSANNLDNYGFDVALSASLGFDTPDPAELNFANASIFNLGHKAGAGMLATNAFGLYNYGSQAGNAMTYIGPDVGNVVQAGIYNFGTYAGQDMQLTNSSHIYNFGSEAGNAMALTDSEDLINIGLGTGSGFVGTATEEIWLGLGGGYVKTSGTVLKVLNGEPTAPVLTVDYQGAITSLATTNHITFGATNPAPVSAVAPTRWVDVRINGEATVYRIPLYE
jgi:hypothetical protein